MWLDKFIFYGRSVGPTFVYLSAAEWLANGNRFPLGRYLLVSIYHLLHQVAEKLLLGEPIGNLGGPWWFINMWLNVHMHKRHRWDFFAQQFPRDIAEDHQLAEDESATRSPLNYGEAIIVPPGTDANENQTGRFFKKLYDGFSKISEPRCLMKIRSLDFHSLSIPLMTHLTRIMIRWWQSLPQKQSHWTTSAAERTPTLFTSSTTRTSSPTGFWSATH